MKETCESGVLAGYPLIDVKVTLVDGSFHDVDYLKWPSKLQVPWLLKTGLKNAILSF